MKHQYLPLLLMLGLLIPLSGCNSDDDLSSAPDFVTELTLEQADGGQTDSFPQGADAVVVLHVRNRSSEDQTLEFADSRVNDFVVLDAQGNAVRLWSDPHDFAQVITEITIAAGATERFEMDWNGLRDDQGEALPPGHYEIQGWLPTEDEDGIDELEPSPLRSTLVAFEITD